VIEKLIYLKYQKEWVKKMEKNMFVQLDVMAKEDLVPEDNTIERYVKTFLDLVILSVLSGKALYGYKIIAIIHKEFGILLSPASLYPLLHVLEGQKLIKSNSDNGRTFYQLSPRGEETFRKKYISYNLSNQIISNFMRKDSLT
jgi:DNA-binding PadR family transcriptional regulator